MQESCKIFKRTCERISCPTICLIKELINLFKTRNEKKKKEQQWEQTLVHHSLGPRHSPNHILTHLLLMTPWGGCLYQQHFAKKETEAWES